MIPAIGSNRNEPVIALCLTGFSLFCLNYPDKSAWYHASGENLFIHDDENVCGIAIGGSRSGDEAEGVREHHSLRQYTGK
jgi:hypothetical protein